MYLYYGYSAIVNVLDYTACTFPVTTVDKNIDKMKLSFEPVSDLDKKVMASCKSSLIFPSLSPLSQECSGSLCALGA